MDCGGCQVVSQVGWGLGGLWFDSCCFQFFIDNLIFYKLLGASALGKEVNAFLPEVIRD